MCTHSSVYVASVSSGDWSRPSQSRGGDRVKGRPVELRADSVGFGGALPQPHIIDKGFAPVLTFSVAHTLLWVIFFKSL
jgi:hypothetical protein